MFHIVELNLFCNKVCETSPVMQCPLQTRFEVSFEHGSIDDVIKSKK